MKDVILQKKSTTLNLLKQLYKSKQLLQMNR